MVKITRKIEILNAKLKEKNKKIYELEKKGKPKYEQINIKLYIIILPFNMPILNYG